MPFKPNYRQQRAERNRSKEQRKQEKLQRQEERVARRRATQDEPPTADLAAEDVAEDIIEGAPSETAMARKKQPLEPSFVLFDVLYEDGTRTSNRKVPGADLGGLDGDEPARAFIEEQDRKIAEMSGKPRGPIKSITRSAKA